MGRLVWEESNEQTKSLRTGLSTGSCATACSLACASRLLANQQPKIISITLPKGKIVELSIIAYQQLDKAIRASTIKDAGDDPDVTHGATVFVELRLIPQRAFIFKAGEGVGTVTRDGLALAVGEPAINPVPRQMITEHLQSMAKQYHYKGGFEVTVGIENGEAIAQKTMNPRLGIVGGLSILGTTGIVRPFSCAAWIASIHQGIDVAKANGIKHIAASTGNSSEAAIKSHYGLDDMALIEMGDFAGAVLKHLKKAPIEKLSICGGFGKISKLANGHMDLNSRASAIDFDHLGAISKHLGASDKLLNSIKNANTSIEVLKLCQMENIDIVPVLCEAALSKAQSIVPESVQVEVWAIDRRGHFAGNAGVKSQ